MKASNAAVGGVRSYSHKFFEIAVIDSGHLS